MRQLTKKYNKLITYSSKLIDIISLFPNFNTDKINWKKIKFSALLDLLYKNVRSLVISIEALKKENENIIKKSNGINFDPLKVQSFNTYPELTLRYDCKSNQWVATVNVVKNNNSLVGSLASMLLNLQNKNYISFGDTAKSAIQSVLSKM